MAASDLLAEIADRLEVRVHRWEYHRHGGRALGDDVDASVDRGERLAHVPEVDDDPQQADRGERDDQRGHHQGHPGGCRHGRTPFVRAEWLSREAWPRSPRTAWPRR